MPALIPLGIASVLAVVFDSGRAPTFAAIGVVFGLFIALGVPVHHWIGTAVAWAVRALAAVLGVATYLVLILPAWLWTTIRRRSPLATPTAPGTKWAPAVPAAQNPSARRLGSDLPDRPGGRSLTGRLVLAVGAATLLLGANYLVGWAWDPITDEDPDPVVGLTPSAAPVYQGETLSRPA